MVVFMKPLVLTSEPPLHFPRDFADLALCLAFFHFTWGPQPSQDEVAAHLGPRAPTHDGIGAMHWSDWCGQWKQSDQRKHRDLSLADFCRHYATVELWFDIRHEPQLKLIWL